MLTINFPWPPSALLPNNRNGRHWGATHKPKAIYRDACYLLTKEAIHGRSVALPDTIRPHIQFYPPDKRRRDDDGMVGAFKNGRDGMALALGVDDSRFRCVYEICDPVPGGKITVNIN